MRKLPKFSPEVVERAVRMVFDAKDQYPSQWAAIESIAGKIGCTAETLRRWVRQGERDGGVRDGPTTAEQQRVKALERIHLVTVKLLHLPAPPAAKLRSQLSQMPFPLASPPYEAQPASSVGEPVGAVSASAGRDSVSEGL